MPDALRLALGTLTIVRVPAPRSVSRPVAGRAMLLAPAVGALLGLVAAAVLTAVRLLAAPSSTADLLASLLAVATLAWLTRGLHLDGLADTADGLGVKADGPDAAALRLAVMRRPDVGAFGVVTVVLVVAVQVVALATCAGHSGAAAAGAVVVASTVGRLAATWACTASVPAARADGLGAGVAGAVSRPAALAATVLVVVAAALIGLLGHDAGPSAGVPLAVGAVVGLLAALPLLRRCVRRFGGITGDVLGAVVELSTAATLLATALALGLHAR